MTWAGAGITANDTIAWTQPSTAAASSAVKRLSEPAAAVRDALLAAREPDALLLRELPLALGQPELAPSGGEAAAVERYVRALNASLDELSGAYGALLTELATVLQDAFAVIGTPAELREDLRSRARPLLKQVIDPTMRSLLLAFAHLGAETADDVVWLTTLEELRDLLTSDSVFPVVRRLTGFTRDLLRWKLDEIREIRNVVGHHRAVSQKTLRILEGDVLSFESGLIFFRESVLENKAAGFRPLEGDIGEDIQRHLDDVVKGAELTTPVDALGLRESGLFYFAVVVPRYMRNTVSDEERELGEWVDASIAVASLEPVKNLVLSVVVPLRGGGYSLMWSKKAKGIEHFEIVDAFVDTVDRLWCDEKYTEQEERYVCHPKLWFHSGR